MINFEIASVEWNSQFTKQTGNKLENCLLNSPILLSIGAIDLDLENGVCKQQDIYEP
jgi:hypothetical protein